MDFLSPLPAAGEVLSWLATTGIYLAVVSNKAGGYLRAEAQRLGWDKYFGSIIGATDAEQDKPAIAPVQMALNGSGIEAGSDVWFAGDGAIDVQCAINSGLTPVVLMHEGTEQELARHNLVQFVDTECRLRGMEGLKNLVEERIFPISER